MSQETASPSITIITVVYNGADLIEKTIESVIGQTYPLQYIIVDGESKDGSLDIIKRYDKQISHWMSEKDNGIYDAMNKGVNLASGDWICFLNCGDVFADAHTVATVAENIQANNQPDIIYGDIFTRNADGTLRLKPAKEPCNLHRMYFCHQASFSKRSLLQAFPFDIKHKLSADLKFFKECFSRNCRFVHVNVPFVVYDTTGISNTNREAGLRDNIAVIKSIDKHFSKYLFLLRLYFVIYWRRLNNK